MSFSAHYTAATWNSATTPPTLTDPGTVGVADLLGDRLLFALKADATVSDIAKGIHRKRRPPEADMRTTPRIYVYPGTTDPSEGAVSLDRETVRFIIAVDYADPGPTDCTSGEPTICTFLDDIKRVVRSHQEMHVTSGGTQVQLVRDTTLFPHQTIEVLSETEQLLGYRQEIPVEYEVNLERLTAATRGRIDNLVAAGAYA